MEVSKTQGSAPLALPLTTIEVKKNMDHLKKILLKKNDIFVEIKRLKKNTCRNLFFLIYILHLIT